MPRVIIYHRLDSHPSSRMAPPTSLDVPSQITGSEIYSFFHLDPNQNEHHLYTIISGRIRWDLPVEPDDTFEINRDREFYFGLKA